MNTTASLESLVRIVDDDPDLRMLLLLILEDAGIHAKTYPSALKLLEDLPSEESGCLILDLEMPEMGGLQLLEQLTKDPYCPAVIVLTGRASVPAAVKSMKLGTFEFLQKP